jgi:hypothetical protein
MIWAAKAHCTRIMSVPFFAGQPPARNHFFPIGLDNHHFYFTLPALRASTRVVSFQDDSQVGRMFSFPRRFEWNAADINKPASFHGIAGSAWLHSAQRMVPSRRNFALCTSCAHPRINA